MIKVCHFTSVHPAKDIRIFHKECSSLALSGLFDVHLVAPNCLNEVVNGVTIHGVEIKKGSRINRMIHGAKKIMQKAQEINADIYHFHDPELIRYGKKLQAKGKKVIYDVHEDVPRQILTKHWIPGMLRKLIANRFEKFENKSAGVFSAIIAATPHIESRFKSYAKKTVCIYNSPLLKEFNLGFLPDFKENKLVYVGVISKERGIVELIKAIEGTNYVLLLAGKFVTSELQQECQQMLGWKNVEYFGTVDREKIGQILQSSKAGMVTLHPTLNYIDSLPIKMFEYMGAGIPVIASNFPLWKDIVEKYACGICVDPLNTNQIKEAIEKVFGDVAIAKQMGENGRKYVLAEFNWEIEEKKLIRLYQEL